MGGCRCRCVTAGGDTEEAAEVADEMGLVVPSEAGGDVDQLGSGIGVEPGGGIAQAAAHQDPLGCNTKVATEQTLYPTGGQVRVMADVLDPDDPAVAPDPVDESSHEKVARVGVGRA